MSNVKSFFLALVLMLTSIAAQAQTQNFNIKVGDFKQIVVQDIIDVIVIQDAKRAGTATFTCTKRVANCLIFTNNSKGRLKVEVAEDMLGKDKAPVITVYSSDLEYVQNDNVGRVTVNENVKGDKFAAVSTGNGNIIVNKVDVDNLELKSITGKGSIKVNSGKCGDLYMRLVGAGTIDADAVVAKKARLRSAGVGTTKCHVEGGELNIKASGSGKVYYRGNPSKVVTHKLGSLKAIKVD